MRPVMILLIGVLLPLGGCAGTTAPSGGATDPVWVTQARGFGRVGEEVAVLANYRVALHGVMDPLEDEAGSEVGTRLLALDVTVTAMVDGVAYRAHYGTLTLADGTVATARPFGPEPTLASGTLDAGASARGWLTFAIYADAAPVLFAYTIPSADGGSGTALFILDDR